MHKLLFIFLFLIGLILLVPTIGITHDFVDNYYEIPNNGINSFIIDGHLASGGVLHPQLTADGLTMFYLRMDTDAPCYLESPYTCHYSNLVFEADIWKATRANTTPTTPWTTPIRLTKGVANEINTDHAESSMSISTWSPMDGKIMYFCSDRNGAVRPFVAVYNEGTGIFDVQSQDEFASFVTAFPFNNLTGISISSSGHFLLLESVPFPNIMDSAYYYAECTTWSDTLHRCTLWGTPVALTTINVTKPTTEPLLQYILDNPAIYFGGSLFAASFGPDDDYIYYTFSKALSGGILGVGDFITRIKNDGPGVNISANNIELVHGDLNGVVNYTTGIMRKMDESKPGTLFTNGWYTETPHVWKNPTNSRYYIYAHTDAKLYMGEIIQSANQCYGDCDCEDGNASAFELCTIASHTCPGGAVPGATGPLNIIINY